MGIFNGAILFCDIDGTLVANGVIPQRNIEKIEFFIKEGGRFSLCTGRHFAGNKDIVSAISGIGLSVVLNGGMIYNYENGEILCEKTIAKEDYHCVLDVINSGFDCGIEIHAGKRVLTLLKNEKTDEHQRAQELETTVLTFEEAAKFDWNKVAFMLNDFGDYEKIASIIDTANTNSSFLCTCTYIYGKKRYYFEQSPTGISKALAMSNLCEMLNIEKGKCFAIGDYFNDLEMLKNADISATTVEAPDEIKEISNFVGCSCKEGAVAEFIDYLTEKFKN